MGGFSPVFPVPGGSGAIYSSRLSYQAIALSANLAMSWPAESSQVGNFVADTMDVTPTANGFSLTMPTALASSTGIATIVTNQSGTYSFSVLNNLGATILTVAPGTAWLLYLTDNSTQAGTWKSFQFGANAGSINLAAITGPGIEVLSGALVTTLAVTNTGGSSAYTVVAGQRASVILWAGGAGTITLPNPATVGSNWWAVVTNAGSGNAVASGAAGNIDGVASKTFAPGNSCIVFTDGANYYTVGFQAASSGSTFSNTTIATTGGTTTLAGAQLNQITYKITGALASNATIVVPVTTQQYWFNNQTTGAFSVTVQSATPGSTVVVPQGGQTIMYCDPAGNMVLGVSTASVTYPISIMNGGTSATTAGAALTNLGGTTTGVALFTAASSAAAIATLGAVASVFGRSGTVVAATNDYAFSQISGSVAAGQLPALSITGDATGTGSAGTGSVGITLATVVTAGSVGSSTQIPVLTYDAKGRLTAVSSATVSSSGVTTLTGTANQIAVSASTGAVTLSFPNNVIIPAPASGVALKVNAVSGTHPLQQQDSAVGGPFNVGYLEVPQNAQNGNYTAALADNGKHIYHSDGSPYTYTIPANASVAYPVGACLTFVNDSSGANNITIAINSDTLVWSPSGTTGSRTLSQYGKATAIKVTSTRWYISGTGLS